MPVSEKYWIVIYYESRLDKGVETYFKYNEGWTREFFIALDPCDFVWAPYILYEEKLFLYLCKIMSKSHEFFYMIRMDTGAQYGGMYIFFLSLH